MVPTVLRWRSGLSPRGSGPLSTSRRPWLADLSNVIASMGLGTPARARQLAGSGAPEGHPALRSARLSLLERICFSLPPVVGEKDRLIADWLVGPFVGRDLINMNVHRPMSVRPVMFEPGQDIVREGEVGQSLYLIRSGEVEVFKRSEHRGPPEQLATLGPGERLAKSPSSAARDEPPRFARKPVRAAPCDERGRPCAEQFEPGVGATPVCFACRKLGLSVDHLCRAESPEINCPG